MLELLKQNVLLILQLAAAYRGAQYARETHQEIDRILRKLLGLWIVDFQHSKHGALEADGHIYNRMEPVLPEQGRPVHCRIAADIFNMDGLRRQEGAAAW